MGLDFGRIESGARKIYEGLMLLAQQIPNQTIREDIEHIAEACVSQMFSHSPTVRDLAKTDADYAKLPEVFAEAISAYRKDLGEVVHPYKKRLREEQEAKGR